MRRFYDGGFEPEMTRREAALILGVRESAAKDKVMAAHRKVMIANHPGRRKRLHRHEDQRGQGEVTRRRGSKDSLLTIAKGPIVSCHRGKGAEFWPLASINISSVETKNPFAAGGVASHPHPLRGPRGGAVRPSVQRCFPPFLALLPTLYLPSSNTPRRRLFTSCCGREKYFTGRGRGEVVVSALVVEGAHVV